MLGSAVIVFREVLEAALIIAIVLGATRGVAGRGRWVSAGIAGGVLGALVVAAFAGAIAGAVQGRGQELLNAGILLAAVAMLAWHNVWMSAHGREVAAQMKSVGHDVSVGAKPLSALALVTLFAVLREGSETALFLFSLSASGAGGHALLFGGVLGLAAGAAVGFILYRGLLAIPIGRFFSVTGWLILLLASGLAANAAGFLNQAGLVPALAPQVWDSGWLLQQDSWLGTLLHILVGYNDRPMGIQVMFYLVTLAGIYALMWLFGSSRPRAAAPQRAA
ncbi:MAG: FTR1 family protein [Arenicellales bacterium]